ncbi:uncharacterized protein LOC111674368 [Orussus abietinus]|uniref:uncharacterized protein LOC111674368 n=1 Tax=Orussus abietinus TaxID=222816 RepID=UPI000C715B37|nr:uncharacterized protein LOC111674368 [Orussus abietinus]
MQLRGDKVYDFVSVERDFKESEKKTKQKQIDWLRKYKWLIEEYTNVEREMQELCDEKAIRMDRFKEDERSCLPIPETTSGAYGWLASKPEFLLEKYGPYRGNRVKPPRM